MEIPGEMGAERSLLIKVCGMRDPENLDEVCSLSPDYVGYIFYSRSARFVGSHPDRALFDIPGPGIRKVGVFVNEEISRIRNAVDSFGLDAVQLHGSESPDYCRSLDRKQVQVIKAVDPRKSQAEQKRYRGAVDYLIFDSAGEGSGGSGLKFDWKLLEDQGLQLPFLLSGGIGPEDAAPILSLQLEGFAGVDVNSRFERFPGMKDVQLLERFITEIRKIGSYGI